MLETSAVTGVDVERAMAWAAELSGAKEWSWMQRVSFSVGTFLKATEQRPESAMVHGSLIEQFFREQRLVRGRWILLLSSGQIELRMLS